MKVKELTEVGQRFIYNLIDILNFYHSTSTTYISTMKTLKEKQNNDLRSQLKALKSPAPSSKSIPESSKISALYKELEAQGIILPQVGITNYENLIKSIEKNDNLLTQYAIVILIANFEAYLSDILKYIFKININALKSSKSILFEEVLNFKSLGNLQIFLIEKEICDLFYGEFRKISDYFNKKFGFDIKCPKISKDEIAELFQTRNIIIHNSGVVNKKYIDKVVNSRFTEGSLREIEPDEIYLVIEKLMGLTFFLDGKVKEKFN